MTAAPTPLTFTAVDGLGFAAAGGHLDETRPPTPFVPRSLGPLLELLFLVASHRLPAAAAGSWLTANGSAPMIAALRENRDQWISTDRQRMGFVRAIRHGRDADEQFTAFLMNAKRAARQVSGLADATSGQLAAAMQELETNIHEHSGAADTGILAFRSARGVFEFVAADRGVGVLASLRDSHPGLRDHGEALQSALTDGTSRFGDNRGHGHGFRPIFIGLANLYGFLRFRSGDHALIMDGSSPTLTTAQIAQKAPIEGFFASVRCQADCSRRRPKN